MKKRPILTIAIPTWNRAEYLRLNLEQLATMAGGAVAEDVEVLVSDNRSDDDTPAVAAAFADAGMSLRYIRNDGNIGSDCNIAQCFNEASGEYVMILGDDDLLLDGAIDFLLRLLREGPCGVVSIRAYGYDDDFRREHPGGEGRARVFDSVGEFAVASGIFSTLISANIISKDALPGVDAREFCGSNLVQTHLFYRAALSAGRNVFVDRYLVACKRNNSGGYQFSQVFVDNFSAILDEYRERGLPGYAVRRIERRLLIGFFPQYVWRMRLTGNEDVMAAWKRYRSRYAGRLSLYLFIAPVIFLPRPMALAWGALAAAAGRLLNGDARRGISFLLYRLRRLVQGGGKGE